MAQGQRHGLPEAWTVGVQDLGSGSGPHLQTHTLSFVASPLATAHRAQNLQHRAVYFAALASM